jgi:tRNA uridine 5-carboxymethylaminomethyl modification enzyme
LVPGLEGVAGLALAEVVRRPEVGLEQVMHVAELCAPADAVQLVEEEIKYAGYIEREARHIERMRELESFTLATGLSYVDTPGLSREIQEKLTAIQPLTLGQASRIPGMTPAALALLRVHARRGEAIA